MKRVLTLILSFQLFYSPFALANSEQCRALFSPVPQRTLQVQAKEWGLKSVSALLTFPLPVKPLYRALSDSDKRYTIIEKSFILGPITTGVAVSVARLLSGSDAPWINNFIDSYISYTGKDIIGMGVALDQKLKGWQKVLDQLWVHGWRVFASDNDYLWYFAPHY
ncbi:MAG: hypothetical protein R2827_06155 [Bdellovibrionales bacterium]